MYLPGEHCWGGGQEPVGCALNEFTFLLGSGCVFSYESYKKLPKEEEEEEEAGFLVS